GPASSKIPAPQINLAALPPAQPNAMGPRHATQQPGIGYFAPQGKQSMRPPSQSGPLPSQGVGGPSFPAGCGLAGDWLGGRGVGATVPKPQEPLSSSSFT
ncbi:hypothetical protein Tco_0476630, partial [Tanacetum coccineum]